ncbi:MAG: AMP-binding protein [Casimicrobiaceae bacterium]
MNPRGGNRAMDLQRSATAWPRHAALARGDVVTCDYATLATRVSRLAHAMRGAGLRDGDRVAIVSRNCAEYIETLYACWWAGLVAVPVNAKLHPRELAFILADSGARWVFADAQWAASMPLAADGVRVVEFGTREYRTMLAAEPLASPIDAGGDAPAWLFYTSGTTGRPKGVVITHANLGAMTACFVADVEPIAVGDAILHPAPLSHGSGLYVVAHVAHAAVNVVPESGGFDAAEVAALLSQWDRALFFAAPTMVKRLVRTASIGGGALARLKCVVFGGGPMYVADCKEAFAALGPRLAQIYGQGESPMTIAAMNRATLAVAIARGDDARLASVGTAQRGVTLRIGDADAASGCDREPGEVLVRAPTVMRGYWNDPAATAAALAGGWLHTGDIGLLDADGYLTLKDRSKDLIISGGSNIYPREVEEVLQHHAAVAEVAVVGRVHAEWGEEAVACIVLRDGADAHSVRRECDALCIERIARFKRPKDYVFVSALPKNNAGKILKTELRALLAAR